MVGRGGNTREGSGCAAHRREEATVRWRRIRFRVKFRINLRI